MIHKYTVTVIRTDVFNVELDDEVYNKAWAEKFSTYLYDIDIENPTMDAAKNMAIQTTRQGTVTFIEGFGIIPLKGRTCFENPRDIAEGVVIEPLSFDEDYETEILHIEAEMPLKGGNQ